MYSIMITRSLTLPEVVDTGSIIRTYNQFSRVYSSTYSVLLVMQCNTPSHIPVNSLQLNPVSPPQHLPFLVGPPRD